MRYFWAVLIPPLAVFLCSKPIQGILNILLTLCFYLPGLIHALFVVSSHLADKRTDKLVKAIEKSETKTEKE